MFRLSSEVVDDETLARFVLFKRHFRSSDQTVKPDAFIPHPRTDLSVTRHKGISERELWRIGRAVASERQKTLFGRADTHARNIRDQGLDVESSPIQRNKNHADVINWPIEKSHQKRLAQEIAATASYFASK